MSPPIVELEKKVTDTLGIISIEIKIDGKMSSLGAIAMGSSAALLWAVNPKLQRDYYLQQLAGFYKELKTPNLTAMPGKRTEQMGF